jgi:hypothetical protein
MRGRPVVLVWLAAVTAGMIVSCGSRTGLFSDDYLATSTEGPHNDLEAGARDGSADGEPSLDALPPLDVQPKPDVDRTDCPDADATYIYVVTSQNELFSFYPPSLTFHFIGNLVCPAPPGETPFSMAVDRKGKAFVVYTNGDLFQVSTATAACTGTAWTPHLGTFTTFGMGFSSDTGGAAEQLYVADSNPNGNSRGLGTIDVTTFQLTTIGSFSPPLPRAELTGTGDGRLFAFWPDGVAPTGSHVAEVQKTTANVVAQTDLPIAHKNDAFAFAFWGGDFWIFTSPGTASEVSRFRPADGTTQTLTTHPSTIVGAGVSTCAPSF